MDTVIGFWDKEVIKNREMMGNKGYNLYQMYQEDISVPPGFLLTTDACREYYQQSKTFPLRYKELIFRKIKELEYYTKKKIGDEKNPLMISIRSGAPVSMPGMLDTILNVGITQKMLENCKDSYMFRSYLIFMNEYVKGVYGIELREADDENKLMTVEQLQNCIERKLQRFQQLVQKPFCDDILEVIENAICAVFQSWEKPSARLYRKQRGIPEDLYTAVVIQEMKFGNKDGHSGSGVLFTRNPLTGKKELYGEYVLNGQGIEVVNGIAETRAIDKLKQDNEEVYKQLVKEVSKIEKLYLEAQDIEFTFEENNLYILQTRKAVEGQKSI